MTVSRQTDVLANIIPYGKENAISREALAAKLGMSDRKMRDAVSTARQEGIVILNDQDGKGYYRSENVDEIRKQRSQTIHRAVALFKQARVCDEDIKRILDWAQVRDWI